MHGAQMSHNAPAPSLFTAQTIRFPCKLYLAMLLSIDPTFGSPSCAWVHAYPSNVIAVSTWTEATTHTTRTHKATTRQRACVRAPAQERCTPIDNRVRRKKRLLRSGAASCHPRAHASADGAHLEHTQNDPQQEAEQPPRGVAEVEPRYNVMAQHTHDQAEQWQRDEPHARRRRRCELESAAGGGVVGGRLSPTARPMVLRIIAEDPNKRGVDLRRGGG